MPAVAKPHELNGSAVPDFSAFEEILAGVDQIEAADARKRAAYEDAVGVYLDDPVEPSVGALVSRGKLADLKITDAVCELPPDIAAKLINAVLINAFNAWHTDFVRKLGSGPE